MATDPYRNPSPQKYEYRVFCQDVNRLEEWMNELAKAGFRICGGPSKGQYSTAVIMEREVG